MLGQHMQRRDEQGQRHKKEKVNGDASIFLAFSVPSHKHSEGDTKPVEIHLCLSLLHWSCEGWQWPWGGCVRSSVCWSIFPVMCWSSADLQDSLGEGKFPLFTSGKNSRGFSLILKK